MTGWGYGDLSGKVLRIILAAEATIVWSTDGWAHTSTATGTPSSTASCKGKLWALSSSTQNRSPGNKVM